MSLLRASLPCLPGPTLRLRGSPTQLNDKVRSYEVRTKRVSDGVARKNKAPATWGQKGKTQRDDKLDIHTSQDASGRQITRRNRRARPVLCLREIPSSQHDLREDCNEGNSWGDASHLEKPLALLLAFPYPMNSQCGLDYLTYQIDNSSTGQNVLQLLLSSLGISTYFS